VDVSVRASREVCMLMKTINICQHSRYIQLIFTSFFCQELASVTMMRKEHIKSSPYEKHNRKLRANKMAPPFLIKLDLVVMYH
jgi:hypothetical protein